MRVPLAVSMLGLLVLLAANVWAQVPGATPGAPEPFQPGGFGGPGPGGRPGGMQPVPIIERVLEGLALTDAEAAAARSTFQAKMERRAALRQKAAALGDLARGDAGTDKQLARKVREFETAVEA